MSSVQSFKECLYVWVRRLLCSIVLLLVMPPPERGGLSVKTREAPWCLKKYVLFRLEHLTIGYFGRNVWYLALVYNLWGALMSSTQSQTKYFWSSQGLSHLNSGTLNCFFFTTFAHSTSGLPESISHQASVTAQTFMLNMEAAVRYYRGINLVANFFVIFYWHAEVQFLPFSGPQEEHPSLPNHFKAHSGKLSHLVSDIWAPFIFARQKISHSAAVTTAL